MTRAVSCLDDRLRAALARLAEVLIPGGEGMPSAREVDLAGALIDRAIEVRPKAEGRFVVMLQGLAASLDTGANPEALLRDLDATDHDSMTLLASFVIGAYYLDRRVRLAIGYPGQGPSVSTDDNFVAEGLLDPVLKGGAYV